MNYGPRFLQILSSMLAFVLIGSVVGSTYAQNLQRTPAPTASEVVSDKEEGEVRMAITVTSFVVGVGAGGYSHLETKNAEARRSVQSMVVLDDMRVPAGKGIVEAILRGTHDGDVIRLEYTVTNYQQFSRAFSEIQASVQIWYNRVNELRAALEGLQARRAEVTHNALATKMDREIKSLQEVLRDANQRLSKAKSTLGFAKRKMEHHGQTGSFWRSFRVVRDVLVNEQSIAATTEKYIDYLRTQTTRPAASLRMRESVSEVKVTRVLVPNSSLVARSLVRARGAAAAAGVALGVTVEEAIFGWLSQNIQEGLNGHYAPEMNAAPPIK